METENHTNSSPENRPQETPEQQEVSALLQKMAETLDNQPSQISEGENENQEKINIAWEKILSGFPENLQKEFREERPNPIQEDIDAYRSLQLVSPEPKSVPLKELLKNNEEIILRSTPDVIEEINKKWGTNFDVSLSKVYDQNPDRVRKYSQMPAETAQPSVSVDGEIMFGVGRFVAALLRGDEDLKIWELSRKNNSDSPKENEKLTTTEKIEDNPDQKDKTREKVEKAFMGEVGQSLVRLSGEIEEFEGTLKNNRFNPISFNAEDFRSAALNESIDFGKATQAFTDLYTALRKDFMPSDNRDKLLIEPHNFTRVMDSLDNLRGIIISIKRKISERKTEDEKGVEELPASITKVANTMRKKMDDLEDSRTLLRRLTGR